MSSSSFEELDVAPILDAVRSSSCAHIVDEVAKRIQPSVGIAWTRARLAPSKLGQSRAAGSPDVPEGFEWPSTRGSPLDFIAQIDLSEVYGTCGRSDLPPAGWLYFFYDFEDQPWGLGPEDRPSWAVIFADVDRSTLRTLEFEQRRSFETHRCHCKFTAKLTPPDPAQLEYDGVLPDSSVTWDAREVYRDALASYFDQSAQLLGNPFNIQNDQRFGVTLLAHGFDAAGDVQSTLQRKQLISEAPQWRLLFQCPSDFSDDGPGFEWIGGGQLYFWIRDTDLKRRHFGDVWVQLQTT